METKFKPFDLKAAKNGARVVTRDGQPVRIICFDKQGGCLIVALVKKTGGEALFFYNIDGGMAGADDDYYKKYDLFMALTKHQAYVNIYKGSSRYTSGNLFDSYDDAVNSGEYRELSLIRIATVPVEWEDYD